MCLDGQFAFARGKNFLDFAGADDGVYFRNLLADFAAVALGQASGDDQSLGAAEFLVFGHFQNGVDGFLLRRLDEAARIDDKDVRLARTRRDFVSRARENTHHHLAIHEVFRASEADESDFGHSGAVL